MLKICSWNINGIRSLSKPLKRHLDALNADVICFQETKATCDLPAEYCRVDGYNAYFAHCKTKSGYSGVCIFCREPVRPISAFDDLCAVVPGSAENINGLRDIDFEGRLVIVQLETSENGRLLSIISVYCPRVDPEKADRVIYRDKFLERLKFTVIKLISGGRYDLNF
uniref:exodeoxyribonuclease III n=1 Tax=Mesocestoides corti TaxID=53468 RepID=A0A5K3EHL7_MESCO